MMNPNSAMSSSIDLQLMWNRLLSLVEEQAQALIRTAFSPIVRECGDISAGIFDTEGHMLGQAVTGTPGHINTMAEAVKSMLSHFPLEVMQPGDVYMTNDPWLGSGHLNDFLLVQPIFLDGVVVGLTSCTSHLVDLGGLGMGPDGSDIYDEGLFVPPVKLIEAGRVNDFLVTMVKANSREPVQNEGDIYALIACCETGAQGLIHMMREFSIRSLDQLADHIIETSRNAAREAISKVPAGTYDNALKVDGYDFEIDLRARMTVTADEITVDFDGSSGSSRYGINVPLNYATAYAVFGIRCIVGSDIPNNAGSLAPFRVTGPKGCILNALSPAPVAMRHTLGQLMPDLMFGCLHQALPDKVPAEGASCMYDMPMRNAPSFSEGRNNATRFAVELTHNGGTGARPGKDGLSATAYPSGVWGSQVEITEATAPLLVRRRELRANSGGAGAFRGGLGQDLEIESSEGAPVMLFLSVERMKYPAKGIAGGGAGGLGRVTMTSGETLAGKGQTIVPGDQRVTLSTPGGGGFGDPLTRDVAAVERDLRCELISAEHARELYGVIVDDQGIVDQEATRALRAAILDR
jgi:N-methylhydantoinase B